DDLVTGVQTCALPIFGCRDLAILTLLLRLGLRRGEVAKLMLDDIDWRAGTIVRARRTLLWNGYPDHWRRRLSLQQAAHDPDSVKIGRASCRERGERSV